MTEDTYLHITPTQVETKDLNFPDALQLIASTLLHILKKTEAVAQTEDEEDNKALRNALYDSVSETMGAVLQHFAPELSPNPDMDINKIIAMEDTVLRKKEKITHPRRRLKRGS